MKFHYWLIDIVRHAFGKPSHPGHSWIKRLVADVEAAINQKRTVTFDSADYLPNLMFQKIYSYAPTQFRYEQVELITSTVSSILRLWFHFPSDEASLLQLSLIDIISSSKSPSSILFLDKIWEMYVTPFSTVFNVWNMRTSKANIGTSLAEFEQQFRSHPFATAGSMEYQKLEYLKELIAKWMENNGLDSDTPASVRTYWECSFLKNLFPIMTAGGHNGYFTRYNRFNHYVECFTILFYIRE